MRRLSPSKRKTIYRMFARGDNAEQVAATKGITSQHAESLYLAYLNLPFADKLRLGQPTDSAAVSSNRLADDIKDLERIDLVIQTADKKELASLLDIKRKIKERMMKELLSEPAASSARASNEAEPGAGDPDEKLLIAEAWKRVFGSLDPETVAATEDIHELERMILEQQSAG